MKDPTQQGGQFSKILPVLIFLSLFISCVSNNTANQNANKESNTAQIAETWRMLTELDERFRAQEPNWDTHGYGQWWNPDWIPFTLGDGDCLCINLDPEGILGEVLWHVHDNPHEPGVATSYAAWLENVANDLEAGEFVIDEYGYLTDRRVILPNRPDSL